MRPEIRVLFAHGLESSPQGSKAMLFAQHFTALTPAMNTRDLPSCVAVHAAAIKDFEPNVVVGSSFGGAVVCELLARGLYRGATLLLAPAALYYNPEARLPADVPITIVHALLDDVVPFEHSRTLLATGTQGMVTLLERDDDHALTKLVESNELVQLVEEVYETRPR